MKKLYAGLIAVAFGVSAYAAETEIKGKLGCAHCDYAEASKAKSCAVGVKTDDGKVYIVTNADSKLMKARTSGKTIVVKGEVSGNEIKASKTEIQN